MSTDGDNITLPVPWAPGHTITGNRNHVQRWIEEVGRQRALRTQWPSQDSGGREWNELAMTKLARLFPSMVRFDGSTVPGCDPWRPAELVRWLNTSGEPTSGSRHAALFLLSVWNRDDWRTFGLKVRRGSGRIGRFDFNDAWGCWDDKHRAAALAWLVNPFWP